MTRRSQPPKSTDEPAGNVAAAHGYRVVGPIGAGASTLLEEAVSRTGRRVAIKRGRRGVGPTAKALLNEAEVLGRLAHPNVVLFIEPIGPHEDPWLVLELLEGQSLRALLEAHVRLSPEVAGRIAYDLAEALMHLEERGVVHGDIGPDNVFVTHGGVVKLIDFGSAHLLDGVTSGTATFATPAYVAPERLLGEPGDGKSDLFSLGVVLYEMLTGHLPWRDDAEGSGRVARKLVPLRERNRSLPGRLEALVHELLSRNPADRPMSAEGLFEAFGPRVAATSPRDLAQALRGNEPAPSASMGLLRDLAARYGAVLAAFVVMATLLRMFLGENIARAEHEGVVGEEASEYGRLRVVAKPWAEVWIDGQLVETTPFATPLRLVPGAHTLTLKHPLAAADEREIVAVAGEELVVKKSFDVPKPAPKPKEADEGPVKRTKIQ